jgi:hypothetical protein
MDDERADRERDLTTEELWAAQRQAHGEVQAARDALRGEDVLYGVAPLLAALRAGKREIHHVFIQVWPKSCVVAALWYLIWYLLVWCCSG